MFYRLFPVIVLCTGLILCLAPPAMAQDADHSTAAELYTQGMDQFNAGDLEAARAVFRRVDPMQLPRDERVKMYEAMQKLDAQTKPAPAAPTESTTTEQPAASSETVTPPDSAQPAEAASVVAVPQPAVEEAPPAPPTPDVLLKQADDQASISPTTASSLYLDVAHHPDATDQHKAIAGARLAQIQRDAQEEVTDARKLIDESVVDLQEGNLQQAQLKLEAVKTRGTQLGWFDQERLDQTLASVNSQLQAIAQASAAADAAVVEKQSAQAQREGFIPAPETDMASGTAPIAEIAPQLSPVGGQMEPRVPDTDLLKKVRAAAMQKAIYEADQASLSNQHDLAVHKLEQAVRLDPDNSDVQNKLTAAKLARDTAAAPKDPLPLQQEIGHLQAQATLAKFNQQMNSARGLVAQRNYPAALDAAAQAKVVLDQNQQTMPLEQYRQLRADAENLQAKILEDKQLADAMEQKSAEQNRIVKQDAQRQRAQQEQQEEVDGLLRRAMALRREMKYDQALTLIEQALYLDPNNLAGQALKEMILDVRGFVEADALLRQRNLNIQQQGILNIEATIPYKDLITYPADWPQLSQRRLAGLDTTGGESEANRRVGLKLREPVPINFEANRLLNVIDYLRNTTGVNFFVNWTALEAAGVDQNAPISLQLNNIPAEQALRLVLQQVGNEFDPVGFSIIEGIVTISTSRDLQKTTEIRPYDIRDLLVQVPNFSNAPEFDLQSALSNTSTGGGGGGGGSSSSSKGLFGDTNSDEDTDADQPSRTELIIQITELLQDTVGRQEEWAAYGGDISSIRELNGQLIVKTTPENHRQLRDVLSGLRETRAVQISVESRFLVVDENFLEEVGIDLDVQVNNLGGNFGPIGIAQDSISLAQRVTSGLTPDRFILASGQEGNHQPGTFTPGPGFTPQTGRSLNLGVSYVDDLEVNLLIQATQMNQRSLSLTAPRVTFFNGQRAYVTVTRQIAFISDLEPIPDSIGFDITLSVIQSGVVLDVEGTISADRRYVTLTLRPSLARVQDPIDTFPVGGGVILDSNGNVIANIDGAFIQVPELELTSIRATVSIPDRGTLLLGGQRLVSEVEIEAGVPVLSKIPVLNRLFTNTSIVKDERTLLILVRPTIIIQSEEEDLLFPGLLQDVGAYNTGQTF